MINLKCHAVSLLFQSQGKNKDEMRKLNEDIDIKEHNMFSLFSIRSATNYQSSFFHELFK